MDLNRLVLAASLFLMLSQLLLLFVPSHDGLLAASCLGGIALGWVLPTSAALMARAFGSASFGGAMGWAYALTLACAMAATRFIGAVYDASHALYCRLRHLCGAGRDCLRCHPDHDTARGMSIARLLAGPE